MYAVHRSNGSPVNKFPLNLLPHLISSAVTGSTVLNSILSLRLSLCKSLHKGKFLQVFLMVLTRFEM